MTGGAGIGRRPLVTALLVLVALGGLMRAGAGLAVPLKAAVAQRLLERAFDRSRATRRAEKPWSWADTVPVARLRVPRLGVEQVVLGGGSGQALAFGPTLLPGAAEPGVRGTAVIAAHRDTHFRFLRRLRAGDTIELLPVVGPVRRYRVTRAEVVRWDRFALPAGADAAGLALVTCYPFDAVAHGPLRYVLHADLTAPVPAADQAASGA